MPSASHITHNNDPHVTPPKRDDEKRKSIARCAVTENGTILYANDIFHALNDGINARQTKSIFDIITFSDEQYNTPESLTTLPAGEHDIHITGNPIITSFQFDWTTTAEGNRCLIASTVDDDAILYDTSDTLDALMEQIHDATARIHHDANEHHDTDNNNAFMAITNNIMLRLSSDGNITYANNHLHTILGHDIDNITEMSFYDLFPDNDREAIISTLSEITQGEEHFTQFESIIYTQTKKPRWIAWRFSHENDAIYASGLDITETRTKQIDLEKQKKQLLEAEAIGRMGHWHWTIGSDDITWSDEIFRIFGAEKAKFKPSIHSISDMVHKRDLGRVIQTLQRAMIEEKAYDVEFRINRPDGETRYIMCEGRCEKDDNDEVISLYGIMQDMTERVLYEQELRTAKDASEQAYAAKSRFLANMSHELRTPLNAIIGFSEMIEQQMLGPLFNEKYIDYATSIRESGAHLLDLISDILDMSKIEAGKHALDLEAINLKNVIDRAAQMVEGRAHENHIQLRTHDLDECNITLQADRRALTQIFINLLSNAIKFTPAHGSVWVECEHAQDSIILRVCDTGVGIPPTKLAAVLRPFEQASSQYTRDHEGSGLGLSITKELIELHDGTLSIESTIDIGTTVTVQLPYNG